VTQQINEVFGSKDESKDTSSTFAAILTSAGATQNASSVATTIENVNAVVDASTVDGEEDSKVKRQRTYN
jgi:hypothetical protein